MHLTFQRMQFSRQLHLRHLHSSYVCLQLLLFFFQLIRQRTIRPSRAWTVLKLFFIYLLPDHRSLLSFPTRRSSDLSRFSARSLVDAKSVSRPLRLVTSDVSASSSVLRLCKSSCFSCI